ncbi:MAG: hypothetical protein ABEL97_05150 [Salinibacter sp.]
MRYERVSIRSVLGLRFRDATTERPVAEGLQVTVRRTDGRGPPTRAIRTVSGAYVAQGLAGLRAYERVPADIPDDVAEGQVKRTDYLVDVRDRRGRFVPVLMKVALPYTPKRKHRWLYPVFDPPPEEEVGGEGTPEPTVYLFSGVQRPVPSGQAVVYADLVEKVEGTWTPAAHAMVEVQHDVRPGGPGGNSNRNQNREEVWYGVADAEGRASVQFPWPSTRRVGPSVLSGRKVPITVRVYSTPDLPVLSRASRPLMREIMTQADENPRPVYETPGTQTKKLKEELPYGEALVLRTGDHSTLRLAPPSNRS